MNARETVNPVAWLLWFIAVGAAPLTSRQPYYLALTLLIAIVVHLSIPAGERGSSPWRLFAYVGSTVAVLSIGFNVLTVHSGDRPFAALPATWPIIGGRLTYNALVYGAASALAISTLLFAAATFNTVVRHTALIRLIPGPFRRFGVAGAIALNYVPQTIQAGSDIYDAQRARGRQLRSAGDARAFLVPLLGNGLERAVQMSEALETRGYGHENPSAPSGRFQRIRIAVALALCCVALPLLATGRLLEALLLASGAAAVAIVGRSKRGAGLRLSGWTGRSIALALASSAALTVVGLSTVLGDGLSYSPFPRLLWPPFDPVIAGALCLLLTPALIGTGDSR